MNACNIINYKPKEFVDLVDCIVFVSVKNK